MINRETSSITRCGAEGCERPLYARGHCRYHYDYRRRHGGGVIVRRHGEKGSPEYVAWQGMKKRCSDPGNDRYHGRGIRVCERWLKFQTFLADMGRKPSPEHSIDRIDNAGNYEPGNCRWATPVEQSRNTRRNKAVEYRGESRCVSEWAAIFGLSHGIVDWRLRHGWTIEDALTKPKGKLSEQQVLAIRTEIAQRLTNKEIAERYGIDPSMVSMIRHNRVRQHAGASV